MVVATKDEMLQMDLSGNYFEDLENVSYRIQDDVLNNGGVVTNLKEILENETVEDLRNLISLYDLDNMQISVFLPKENQKE